MSEDCPLEEDVWEYKSIRKLTSVCHNLESISKNVQKSNDGNDKSQRSNNRMASKERNTSMKTKRRLRKRDSQTPLKPEQQCNVSDDNPVAQSQEGVSPASAKPKKNYKKQSPSKPRPVYEGYCPSCQMPFSLLLIQTPQWHVTECLDGSSMAEKECPDGLLCTSTIPSHYKRYTHLLLAASRAGEYVPEFLSNSTENNSFMSGVVPSTDYGVLQDMIVSQNVGKPTKQPFLLPTQNSVPANSMNLTNKLTSSLDNTKVSERKIQCIDGSKPVGFLGSLYQEYGEDCQLNTLTSDSSDCDISYSPLNSDGGEAILTEEEEAEEIKHFRKKPFYIGGIEEKSEGDESSVFNASQLRAYNHNNVERIQTCTRNNKSSKMINTLQCIDRSVSEPLSQDKIVNRVYSSTNVEVLELTTDDHTIPAEYKRSKEPFERLKQNSPFNTGEHRWNNCNWAGEDSAVKNMSLSPQFKEDGAMPFLFGQKEAGTCLAKNVSAAGRNSLGPKNSYSLTEKEERLCNSIAMPVFPSPVSKILPYVPATNTQVKCNAAKELKQMDIGVFFGLKPKAKMEDDDKKNLSENMQTLSPSAASGTKPRSRKRKAKGAVGDSDSITESSSKNDILADSTSGGQRRWRKRFKESCPDEEKTRKKQCPFYKKIPGTGFVVDAFQYGEIEGCKGYFLTHFHSDHYGGLTKTFTFPIYCNKITGNLVKYKLRVQEKYIHILPMNRECIIDGIKVVLLDANHCPGAAMILFAFPNGTVILHTGDFRADPSMERYPFLIGRKVNTLYLDTTYCTPEYTFPSQQEVIQFAVNTAVETVTLNPRTLVVCGTYSIGKEKVFLAIADVLGSKVSMSQEKYKTLQCLESAVIDSLITLDWNNTLLHLLPMMQINFKSLQSHLNKFSEKFDQILAFKPTGWTYSDRCCSLSDIQPQTRGKITIYGIPYSEHSSFLEMKRFVQWLKPQKIIPTVNVGNWKTRNEMEKHFRDWKMDAAGWN